MEAEDDTPASESPVLSATGVSRRYRIGNSGWWHRLRSNGAEGPHVTALDDVSISVAAGELVGISGPSGSGKTTLLHVLGGLDVPDAGTVTFDDQDLAALSAAERRRHRLEHVGFVFQRFHLLEAYTARTNVALPLVELGWSKRRRRERAEACLDRVGLGNRLNHRPSQLSGGERQRVALARALATRPALVIADEPTGELDTEAGDRVIAELERIADDRAVVVASHDDRTIAATDRVVELVDGRRVPDRQPDPS